MLELLTAAVSELDDSSRLQLPAAREFFDARLVSKPLGGDVVRGVVVEDGFLELDLPKSIPDNTLLRISSDWQKISVRVLEFPATPPEVDASSKQFQAIDGLLRQALAPVEINNKLTAVSGSEIDVLQPQTAKHIETLLQIVAQQKSYSLADSIKGAISSLQSLDPLSFADSTQFDVLREIVSAFRAVGPSGESVAQSRGDSAQDLLAFVEKHVRDTTKQTDDIVTRLNQISSGEPVDVLRDVITRAQRALEEGIEQTQQSSSRSGGERIDVDSKRLIDRIQVSRVESAQVLASLEALRNAVDEPIVDSSRFMRELQSLSRDAQVKPALEKVRTIHPSIDSSIGDFVRSADYVRDAMIRIQQEGRALSAAEQGALRGEKVLAQKLSESLDALLKTVDAPPAESVSLQPSVAGNTSGSAPAAGGDLVQLARFEQFRDDLNKAQNILTLVRDSAEALAKANISQPPPESNAQNAESVQNRTGQEKLKKEITALMQKLEQQTKSDAGGASYQYQQMSKDLGESFRFLLQSNSSSSGKAVTLNTNSPAVQRSFEQVAQRAQSSLQVIGELQSLLAESGREQNGVVKNELLRIRWSLRELSLQGRSEAPESTTAASLDRTVSRATTTVLSALDSVLISDDPAVREQLKSSAAREQAVSETPARQNQSDRVVQESQASRASEQRAGGQGTRDTIREVIRRLDAVLVEVSREPRISANGASRGQHGGVQDVVQSSSSSATTSVPTETTEGAVSSERVSKVLENLREVTQAIRSAIDTGTGERPERLRALVQSSAFQIIESNVTKQELPAQPVLEALRDNLRVLLQETPVKQGNTPLAVSQFREQLAELLSSLRESVRLQSNTSIQSLLTIAEGVGVRFEEVLTKAPERQSASSFMELREALRVLERNVSSSRMAQDARAASGVNLERQVQTLVRSADALLQQLQIPQEAPLTDSLSSRPRHVMNAQSHLQSHVRAFVDALSDAPSNFRSEARTLFAQVTADLQTTQRLSSSRLDELRREVQRTTQSLYRPTGQTQGVERNTSAPIVAQAERLLEAIDSYSSRGAMTPYSAAPAPPGLTEVASAPLTRAVNDELWSALRQVLQKHQPAAAQADVEQRARQVAQQLLGDETVQQRLSSSPEGTNLVRHLIETLEVHRQQKDAAARRARDINVLTNLERIFRGQEFISQLSPVMQSLGEPGFLLFPFFTQGLISRLEMIFYPGYGTQGNTTVDKSGGNRKRISDKEDDGGAKQHSGQREKRQELAFRVRLPEMGEVRVDFAYCLREAIIAITVESDAVQAFLAEQLLGLETVLAGVGFESVRCSAKVDVCADIRPAWVHSMMNDDALIA